MIKAQHIDRSSAGSRTFALCPSFALLSLFTVAACSQEPSAVNANMAVKIENTSTLAPTPQPAAASPAADFKLAGPADSAAIAAALAKAQRQNMTDITVSKTQSFRLTSGTEQVATVLTGEGKMADAINPGCFVAIQQGDDIELIPTLGYGNYDAETCGGPLAIGILSPSNPVRFGIVFRGYSRDAETSVPLVVEWNRGDNTLLIDDALSTKASNGGATSIADVRRLVDRP